MEQFKVDQQYVVKVDFTDGSFSREVKDLRPLIFKDKDIFCVVLGPDPQEGIFGCGTTVQNALEDWTNHLKERLTTAETEDQVAAYARDVLNADPDKVW